MGERSVLGQRKCPGHVNCKNHNQDRWLGPCDMYSSMGSAESLYNAISAGLSAGPSRKEYGDAALARSGTPDACLNDKQPYAPVPPNYHPLRCCLISLGRLAASLANSVATQVSPCIAHSKAAAISASLSVRAGSSDCSSSQLARLGPENAFAEASKRWPS